MAKKIFYLTRAEIAHVLSCLRSCDCGGDAGWYYGNKRQFDKRHAALLRLFYQGASRASDLDNWR